MAIITLNCNLNGGDSVTPNNELFYRIYGDVDNYTAPIHTTGTAIEDANVTVTDDVVDISNVDGTTNTTFKIAAVDGAGNEGILSDAVSDFAVYFEDNFNSIPITDAQWTKVNPNAGAEFNQAGGTMEIGGTSGAADTPDLGDYMIADVGAEMSSGLVFSYDMIVTGNTNTKYYVGIAPVGGTSNDIIRNFQTTETDITLNGKEGGNTFFASTGYPIDPHTQRTFKISYIGGVVSFDYWDGSSWTNLVSQAQAIAGVWYPILYSRRVSSNVGDCYVDNVFLSSGDFSTQYPT